VVRGHRAGERHAGGSTDRTLDVARRRAGRGRGDPAHAHRHPAHQSPAPERRDPARCRDARPARPLGPAPRRAHDPRRRRSSGVSLLGVDSLMAYGRYFEEFTVGQVLKHWPGRTITEADCTWFALLTMNQHPVHSDAHYAATQTQHGQRLVLGPLVFSIGIGMTVADISGKAIANLEIEKI